MHQAILRRVVGIRDYSDNFMARINAFLLLLAVPLAASCTTIFSTGFEAPTYQIGTLAGQDGWAVSSSVTPTDLVESNVVRSGTQAAQLDTSGVQGDQVLMNRALAVTVPAADTVTIQGDFFLTSSASETDWAFGFTNASNNLAGALYFETNGFYVYSATGYSAFLPGLVRDQWNTIDLVLDLSDSTFSVSDNGVSLGSNYSVNLPQDELQNLIVGSLSTFNTGNDSMYFDNLSVTAVAPEPNTFGFLSLIALATAIFLRRRSDRQRRT